MDAINNLRHVKNNWVSCSEWEIEQEKNDACFDELKQKINPDNPDVARFQNKGKTLINTINTLDQLGINKSENALVSISTAIHTGIQMFFGLGYLTGYLCSKLRNAPNKTPKMTGFVVGNIFASIGAVFGSFISSYFAKTATRISRYQTRNNELKNVRNFVTYTDEQISQAKEKISSIPEVKDVTEDMSIKESSNPIKVYKKSIETGKILKKDYKEYKNWREQYLKNEEKLQQDLKNINLSAEEQKKAEKDKNFILKTIRKMEITANEYELNTKFAIRVFGASIVAIATAGSLLACWGLGKIAQKTHGTVAKTSNLMSKMTIPATIIGLFFVSGPLLKIAKESANLGRFKERENLLSDKRNFYPHTDNEIEDIKKTYKKHHLKKSFLEKIKEDFKFIFQLKNDYKNYLNYKNGIRQEELKMAEILKTMPISTEQLNEAKTLQHQTFMAFEKIDDKSECLVDDTSAAVASVSSLLNHAINCLSKISVIVLFGKKILKHTKNNKLPGFFEGLQLAAKLSLKEMIMICIAPLVIAKAMMLFIGLVGTEIKKHACKIGIMSATKELDNSKKFVSKSDKELLFSDFHKKIVDIKSTSHC